MSAPQQPHIGILALQGDFALHAAAVGHLGCTWIYVKRIEQLDEIDGLIIPGGESTTLLKHFEYQDWLSALQTFHARGGAFLGTCAGAILLATSVTPAQTSLGFIDMHIERNAYGRQVDSFVAEGQMQVDAPDFPEKAVMPMVFIRAPRIVSVGEGVRVLVEHAGHPVLVQQGNAMACTFHPEVDDEQQLPGASSRVSLVHRYFLSRCAGRAA